MSMRLSCFANSCASASRTAKDKSAAGRWPSVQRRSGVSPNAHSCCAKKRSCRSACASRMTSYAVASRRIHSLYRSVSSSIMSFLIYVFVFCNFDIQKQLEMLNLNKLLFDFLVAYVKLTFGMKLINNIHNFLTGATSELHVGPSRARHVWPAATNGE